MKLEAALARDLRIIKEIKPLILNITNDVAMDFTANALLAVGASPVMSSDERELRELVSASRAVVINMGTLNPHWVELAQKAMQLANEYGKPIIFDPVGSGATSLRTESAKKFLKEYAIDIVRGNASEIASLFANNRSNKGPKTKGVDATVSVEDALEIVHDPANVAPSLRVTTFVISGQTDYIVSPKQCFFVKNGDPMMTKVTAMGCTATCIIAAFRSINPETDMAAWEAMTLMGCLGEIATNQTSGPGTLRVRFLDLLAHEDRSLFTNLSVGQL